MSLVITFVLVFAYGLFAFWGGMKVGRKEARRERCGNEAPLPVNRSSTTP
jgi:hypothetical protein